MVRRDIDAALLALGAGQAGAFAMGQARLVGADRHQLERRARAGILRRPCEGVYVLTAWPPSYEQQLWIAHLATRQPNIVAFEAAAKLHRRWGFFEELVVLSARSHDHHRLSGVIVHEISDVFAFDHHMVRIQGLPVTSLARTYVDLAALGRLRGRVRRSLQEATAEGVLTYADVGKVLTDVARRGKPGVQWLATLIDELIGDDELPTGHAERRLFQGLRDAGEPLPVSQAPHPGRDLPRSCTDGLYPLAKMIVEVDSRRWHTRVADIARDRHRDAEAGRAGYYTHRAMAEDVERDLRNQVRVIRDIRVGREALFRAA